MKKTTQFRQLLASDRLEFLLEAHNGLSARIVEEAGFRGVWASGLTISASLGVRDNNEASWTQVLEVAEFMSDATSIPILLDADTGYGNFNNVRRLVRKLEQRDIAAVCIEDKLFPKTNSFIGGEKQPLAQLEEFCGKIRAAKDVQKDPDFCVVARTEAFVTGWGLSEALRRAEAYADAGADAILVHSKKTTADEVTAFMRAWDHRTPVVIVPTTYYSTPTRVFEEAGVRLAIWANHLLRGNVATMQRLARRLREERTPLTLEDEIAPVKEVFRLQGADELKKAEQAYLPVSGSPARAIVLAASRGDALGGFTDDRPKAMVLVQGKPLLQRLVDHFNEVGIKDIAVIAGYKPESVDLPGIRKLLNPDHERTMELGSLSVALQELDRTTVLSYGDILFKRYVLLNLLNEPGDIAIVVDAQPARRRSAYQDLVRCSRPFHADVLDEPVYLKQFEPGLPLDQADGEWIGLLRLSQAAAPRVRRVLEDLRSRPDFAQLRMKDLFQALLERGEQVRCVYIRGHWLDIDNLESLSRAMEF